MGLEPTQVIEEGVSPDSELRASCRDPFPKQSHSHRFWAFSDGHFTSGTSLRPTTYALLGWGPLWGRNPSLVFSVSD